MVIGKNSLCTECGTQFLIDFDNVKLVKPRCLNCRDTKKARAFKVGQAAVGDLFKELELPKNE